ncbi:MAG: protoporphyrinogen oxidase [Thermodesulfovibrionales bacterium]|nr:protoporphyrinogen oxidase [Thermodesulfovibrionales bacterium]
MAEIVIIGGGISGLSLGYFLLKKKSDLEITILESQERPGGKIWTERSEGFICEAGVNGFLDNKKGTLMLAEMLGLKPLRSNDSARKRYVYFKNRLNLIPDNPQKIFLSNFLSLKARLRMIGEYFVPKRELEDETVESFVIRRVGREFFEKLLDPMVTGIYAGDPSKLSIRSCFPKVYDLERKYGGLIKGFIALAKEAKKTGRKVEAGPGGVLHSFEGGMYTLIEYLRDYLGKRIKTGTPVKAVDKINGKYRIYLKNGENMEAERIIVSAPAPETAEMIGDLSKELSALLKEIPYPPISVVALGFRKEDLNIDTDYFGFLIPGKEKKRILGCLFDSSIFPKRAPEGHVLLRCMLGGERAPELAMLDDKELFNTVLEELDSITGLKAEPVFKRIFRYDKAIPQYTIGHSKRLEDIDRILSGFRGLYLAGNAYRGVAINDCIANSAELAEKILAE